MKKLIALSFLVLTMLNCENKGKETENSNFESQKVLEKTETTIDLGCYIFSNGKNIVSMEITKNDKEIEGNLIYILAEKDKNSGNFIGQLKEGILLANYTFQSEGKETIRQIAFEVDRNTLTEGYGESNSEGTAFKDVSRLNFISKMPLTKIDCRKQKETCLYESGKVYSNLQQTCLELVTLKTKLNPLKNGAKTSGNSAFLLFNSDNSKAEIFLPKSDIGIVLEKSKQGNWVFENFTLISWKGYVLHKKGIAIFGG